MQKAPYCLLEIISTIFETARLVSSDSFIHTRVLKKSLEALLACTDEENPLELALVGFREAYQALGVRDPYEKEKARLNLTMTGLEQSLTEYVQAADNPLIAGAQVSLAASDPAIRKLGRAELEKFFNDRLAAGRHPAIDQLAVLANLAAKAKNVLFIANAAGEIVADKLLIAELAKTAQVTVVVAQKPILTRVTAADTETVGINKIADVCDPKQDMLGVFIERSSTAFREKFMQADLVIAKGAINWQSLCRSGRDVFTLLHADDLTIANAISVAEGDAVAALLSEKK